MLEHFEKEAPVASSVETDETDEQTAATARHWASTTSDAENRDVYGSSARDFEVWYERFMGDAKTA